MKDNTYNKKTTVACHRSTIIFALKFKSVVENVTIYREKSHSVAEIAKISFTSPTVINVPTRAIKRMFVNHKERLHGALSCNAVQERTSFKSGDETIKFHNSNS